MSLRLYVSATLTGLLFFYMKICTYTYINHILNSKRAYNSLLLCILVFYDSLKTPALLTHLCIEYTEIIAVNKAKKKKSYS